MKKLIKTFFIATFLLYASFIFSQDIIGKWEAELIDEREKGLFIFNEDNTFVVKNKEDESDDDSFKGGYKIDNENMTITMWNLENEEDNFSFKFNLKNNIMEFFLIDLTTPMVFTYLLEEIEQIKEGKKVTDEFLNEIKQMKDKNKITDELIKEMEKLIKKIKNTEKLTEELKNLLLQMPIIRAVKI